MSYKSSGRKAYDPIGPSCKKTMYHSLEEAEDVIRHIRETREVRELKAYQCEICGQWHLSSQLSDRARL